MNKIPYRNTEEYKVKRRESSKLWYTKNASKQITSNKKYQRKNKLWLEDLKKTLKCNRCSEAESCCLDFHHIDPKSKEYNLCQMINQGCSQQTILEEIEKCEVLCANCHRKHHAMGKQ